MVFFCISGSCSPVFSRTRPAHSFSRWRPEKTQVSKRVYRFPAPGMLEYNGEAVTGDRATQECDLSTVAVPNGMGWRSQRCQPFMPGAAMR